MKEAALAMTYGFAGIDVGFRAGEGRLETAATAAHSLWQGDGGEAKLCEWELQTVGVPVAMVAGMLMGAADCIDCADAGRIVLFEYCWSIRQTNIESAVLVTVRTRGAKQRKGKGKGKEEKEARKTGPAAAQ
ncbi:uncharacterized protein Triagg1_4537 [Trichoderma aggressivum f. europaeum]|uniref:Uncharacterized protein n=1 Tax=Trichoderma aggressivum f. europaeum TaxID=173218 RepID=A0AAE1J7R5_9HYPO|nr:hypothetical protein Triagg1_4537 [Trichoderma aggressivum f. europaeum]